MGHDPYLVAELVYYFSWLAQLILTHPNGFNPAGPVTPLDAAYRRVLRHTRFWPTATEQHMTMSLADITLHVSEAIERLLFHPPEERYTLP